MNSQDIERKKSNKVKIFIQTIHLLLVKYNTRNKNETP